MDPVNHPNFFNAVIDLEIARVAPMLVADDIVDAEFEEVTDDKK